MNRLLTAKQQNKRIHGVMVLLVLVAVAIFVLAPGAYGQTDTNNTSSKNVTNTSEKNDTSSQDLFSDKAYPSYATGYSVEYHGTYKVVKIHDPWGRAAENRTYVLVPARRGKT